MRKKTEIEEIRMVHGSRKYGWEKGDVFPVVRNIMCDCVIIRENLPNVVLSEAKARSYGILKGEPYIYGVGPLKKIKVG